MQVLSNHPVTIALALISAIVWTAGRYYRKKAYSIVGVVLSVAAIAAFLLGK